MKKWLGILFILLFTGTALAGPVITGCGQVPVMGHHGPQATMAWEPETCTYLALPGASLPGSTVDSYIKSVKAGGAVTLTGQKAKFSTVAPIFVTQASQDLRWLAILNATTPLTATFNDGTNTLAMTPVAAGTGETLGSELITTWVNSIYPFETLTVNANGHDITRAVNTAGDYGAAISNVLGTSAGQLLKWVYTRTVASGAIPKISLRLNNALTQPTPAEGPDVTTSGTSYTTVNGDRIAANFLDDTSGTDFAATHSVKRVTTPDSTGFTASNLVGASFNPNAAGFTLTVTK